MKGISVKNIVILLLLIFGFTSCNIKEDMSDCPGYILLDYTAYSDEILEEIDSKTVVNIYIFNNNDICVDILSLTYGELQNANYTLEVPIEYRGYDAVVWHGNNDSDYNASSMALGADLEDIYLYLNTKSDGTFSGVPSELWASELEAIDFCAKITRHRIYMTRLHTEINVTLSQKDDNNVTSTLDMSKYELFIETSNDIYHKDYTISDLSSEIKYTNDDLNSSQVGTLRIIPQNKCILYIVNTETGNRVSVGGETEIDLVEYMLNSKESFDGDDQSFLDLNKIWDINLVLDKFYTAIYLEINGWVVWFNDSNLNKYQ